MSEGRPAYHLPLVGAVFGLASGDLLLGLNPELLRFLPAARVLLVAAASGAILASPLVLMSRARRPSRASAAWSAGLLAAFGVFVEFQRKALHDFVPSGVRRVLVATALAAFFSAAVLAARALRGGPNAGTLSIPIALFLLAPAAGRRVPERPAAGAVTAPRRAPRRNLLVVGFEGASWDLLTAYASEGAMPVVARLLREGAAGPLAPLSPYDRAALWTTAATGKRPLKHGVVSSRRWESPLGTLRLLPVLPGSAVPGGAHPAAEAGAARRSLTFWEILASRGHEAAVLGWPASSPAREGLVLWASDAFFEGSAAGSTALPEEGAAQARLFRVSPDGLDRPLARALVPDGLARGEARLSPLRGAASDLTVTGAALAALPGGPRNVSAIVLSGLAEVSGLFGAAGNARYWGLSVPEADARAAALRAYYRFLDDLLGEILEREGQERTICLFAPASWGPPPTLEAVARFLRGKTPVASPDAARDGFVLFSGAGVRSGVRLTSANVLDLAPTLLVLAGEPVARDMDGRVLAEAFDERLTESASVPIVSTFEAAGPQ
ncbi:MAG: alkaline phosphatase family protein [Acidobacteriota bacterium]